MESVRKFFFVRTCKKEGKGDAGLKGMKKAEARKQEFLTFLPQKFLGLKSFEKFGRDFHMH